MMTVAILPEATEAGVTYRAVAGQKQSVGRTAGEALDALTAQLSDEEAGTLVVVQNRHPDRFFTQAQQDRLGELMARWRTARDTNSSLPPHEQAELDGLVEAELQAAIRRAAALLQDTAP